jgi:outer membrane receptor protein involved in Fe transport
MQGKLPWGLPAGDIAVAFGAEYRHEQGAVTKVDPNNQKGSYSAGNFAPYRGQYAVKEAFAEADVPLLEDQIVQNASFNAAARVTDYSTSGVVETWKVGLTSQVDDNIRLRASWSLDIRAPGIYDLFAPGVVAISQLQYPLGSPNYQAQTAQGGNPDLNPEKAITVSGGVVLTPRWIEGLTLSLDWYSINLHGGIYATGDQTIINRCLSGEAVYCSLLLFSPTENGGTKPYRVNSNPINAASISTSGLDFQSDYRTDLFDGMLNLSLIGNYTDQQSQTALGITYDSAGSLGSPLSYANSGLPKLRGTLSATYSQGPWSGTIQTRFLGSAVLTNGVENLPANITRASMSPTGVLTAGVGGGNLLDYNSVDPVAYLDLRLSYQWSDKIQLYSAIDNATDVPPPTDGSPETYSVLGRIIRAGIRFNN